MISFQKYFPFIQTVKTYKTEYLGKDAFAALKPFGPAADPLKSLALYLVERTH